jgi:Methyltransferase domain
MALNHLWQLYRDAGYVAATAAPREDALDHFYLALLAFGWQAIGQAATYAEQAAEQVPANRVFTQGARYLRRLAQTGRQGVYVSGAGFAAFIREGGNLPLYRATSTALRQIYQNYEALSLLDIGVGDGLALLPALTAQIAQLDILEPSPALLTTVSDRLAAQGVRHRAISSTLQEFAQQSAGQWNVIQATYSLQSIAPAERSTLLRWLREHGERVLIAEFDVPACSDPYAPDHVRYVVERYQRGLAEYIEDGDLVAQEFLMPVLFGYFDQTTDRTNYEQPVQAWIEQLKEAGFDHVEARLLYPYWWASAYLIDAH